MEEVIKGIYRYAGELKSREKPLVLVHPWYRNGNPWGFRKIGIHSDFGGSYLSNLVHLLENSGDRNIFLFEEMGMYDDTLEDIISYRKDERGLYCIPTKLTEPYPFAISLNEASKYIKGFSNNIDIAGGKFDDENLEYGCAGTVSRKLRYLGVNANLVSGCCFK